MIQVKIHQLKLLLNWKNIIEIKMNNKNWNLKDLIEKEDLYVLQNINI